MTMLGGAAEPTAAPVGQRRRRPKDRRARITRAAAEVFSAQGYHAASMKAVAAKVGISGPALYRHYPSKYDMFAASVLGLSQQLVGCTDFVDAIAPGDLAAGPVDVLNAMVDTLIEVTLTNRESGGLYRWQARFLHPEDLATLLAQLRMVNRRIQRPLLMIRPSLSSPQRLMLSSGLLSVIGSIVDHRIQLPATQMRAVLTGAVSAMLTAPLPEPDDDIGEPPPVRRFFAADTGTYEGLLNGAMMLFGERGYCETGMAQIAAAAGIPISGIYRYFPGKYEILATGLRRGVRRVSDDLAVIIGNRTAPRQTLIRLIEVYVAMSFGNPELPLTYYTERINLTTTDRELLRSMLRSTVESWAQLLISVRPELSGRQARVLIYTVMSLAVDLGWLIGYDRLVRAARPVGGSAYPQACVRQLMERVLLGGAGWPQRHDAPPDQLM